MALRIAPRHTATLALVLLTLIWSFNWIVLKTVLRFSGPFDFSALRYVVGTLVLVLVMLIRPEGLIPSKRRRAEFREGVHDTPLYDTEMQ